ncbi:nodulin-13-like [Abrus precatorius]|uniref:Nodulin-13-like n=1 Tax=Abrus precatorius TaxID=3816 RepID=A0A8B8K3I3_ABRPR|nr:nodulin-13-like [Abrus precatorius]
MGVVTTEIEITCAVAPAILYKAMVLDATKIFPKALPNFIKSVDIIEGDGGPGSIKQFTLPEGYVKLEVNVVDSINYVYQCTIIEAVTSILSDPLEKISNEYKFVGSLDGGCIVKSTGKYYTKGDEQLTEEFLKPNKERFTLFTKGIEDYLMANPDYN